MIKTLTSACAIALLAGAANAVVIDFEDFGTAALDPLAPTFTGDADGVLAGDQNWNVFEIVGTEFILDGVTFSFDPAKDDAVNVVRVGGNDVGGPTPTPNDTTNAFFNNDTPTPADRFGRFFGSTTFDPSKPDVGFTATFDAAAKLSFEIADVDGSGRNMEEFTIVAYLLGGAMETIEVNGDGTVVDPMGRLSSVPGGSGALAGNNVVTRFDFGTDQVLKFTVDATTDAGTRVIGWGIDNISYVIPLPAGAWLLGSVMAGLGFASRRRKS